MMGSAIPPIRIGRLMGVPSFRLARAGPGSTPQWLWAGIPGIAGAVWGGSDGGWLAMVGRLPHTRMVGGVEAQGARGRGGRAVVGGSDLGGKGWTGIQPTGHPGPTSGSPSLTGVEAAPSTHKPSSGLPSPDMRTTLNDGSAGGPRQPRTRNRVGEPAPTCGSPSMMGVDATAHTRTLYTAADRLKAIRGETSCWLNRNSRGEPLFASIV